MEDGERGRVEESMKKGVGVKEQMRGDRRRGL